MAVALLIVLFEALVPKFPNSIGVVSPAAHLTARSFKLVSPDHLVALPTASPEALIALALLEVTPAEFVPKPFNNVPKLSPPIQRTAVVFARVFITPAMLLPVVLMASASL